MNMNIIEKLKRRYATKEFDPSKKLSQEKVDILIESFMLSASSFGLQPWSLVYLKDIDKREQLCLHSWNRSQILDSDWVFVLAMQTQIWDKLVDKYINHISSLNWDSKESLLKYEKSMKNFLNSMDDKQKAQWAEKQVMIALGNMMTVCAVEEIDSCPIEWFNKEEVDKILWLKEQKLASVVLLPVGYRNKQDKWLKRWKIRYSKDMLFKII